MASRRGGSIRWNLKGFEEVRRMPGVEDRLQAEVSRILGSLDGDYEGGVEPGASRSRGYVVTTSGDSIRDEAENHTLLRALGGGSA